MAQRGGGDQQNHKMAVFGMTKFKSFSGIRYYLKRAHAFKRDANGEAKGLRGRGYNARVVPVVVGFAVYYR